MNMTIMLQKLCTCSILGISLPRQSRRFSFPYHPRKRNSAAFNVKCCVGNELQPLWDDGYGTRTIKDYLQTTKDMINPDGGPPRWFCPTECRRPVKDSPVLLFLPGFDGIGLGLILHHKALGKVFEVRCMHIPVYDRTPFKGLVNFVENAIRIEHLLSPKRPIYLLAESFGACIGLSVAARNPDIDLVVILANPATSFCISSFWPVVSSLESLPMDLYQSVLPYISGIAIGKVMIKPEEQFGGQLFANPVDLEPHFSSMAEIVPKETLLWKIKLLEYGVSYTNSRLHAVKAEVLVLAGGKDRILPSRDEAQRLSSLLQNCQVRYFKENGHNLLRENGINLLTVIKGAGKYRRSNKHDFVKDFLPPSLQEYDHVGSQQYGFFRLATSQVMFSTLENGQIVRGLKGIPDQGPVLLVGYHMLLGAEIGSIVDEFLREKNIMVRGLAHPAIFSKTLETPSSDPSFFDMFKVFGAVPVTGQNLHKLLSLNSHVLLYPGGVREALHQKGEQYKLFWPDEPEFVRMAVRFGAKIVPFGVVGEDDIFELFFDYNDMMRIPFLKEAIERQNLAASRLRSDMVGEVGARYFFLPGLHPKVPGRFYFLFGKPFETKGKKELVKDKSSAKSFYLQIKSEVEGCMAYLIKKREEDPFRDIFRRMAYHAFSVPTHHIPTFDP